jgi:diguanylate cyclase (GGDEF)-like protein
MYTANDLKKYDYFKAIDINYALDSLTGVLSRANILGFAKELVTNRVPFMMGILDIDNFKLVNDNYGHMVGDECLKAVAQSLADYVGQDGVVGRFGGDEFVIICFNVLEYNDIHDYVEKMLNDGMVSRRRLCIQDVSFYITSTVGIATFPKDAKTYDELFIIADKALYRGKSKGRNCFIIYVEAKHKNIEVHRKIQSSLPNIFSRISELANNERKSVKTRIKNILDFVADVLQISEAALLLTDETLYTSGEGYKCNIDENCIKTFENLTASDNIFIPTDLNIYQNDEKINKFIVDKKIITFIVSRIVISKKIYGYIILFEDKITRIWQENDMALLLYLNKIFELLSLK